MILLKDALSQMEARDVNGALKPFDCIYCTFSRQRSEGGKIVELKGVRLSFDKIPYKGKRAETAEKKVNSKNQPGHFINKTRNVLLPNNQIRKMHIRMLLSFNGQPVVY